jgi:hypothetical protein
MNRTCVSSLAFAVVCALAIAASPAAQAQRLVTNGPQASRGDFGEWSATRNNIESQRYDRLVQTSPAFRQARMRKECGPISDPQLHASCIASFGQYEPPMYGSSGPPRAYRYHPHLGE